MHILMNWAETWTWRKVYIKRLTTAEMRLLRSKEETK
jgi:hypothetical protein